MRASTPWLRALLILVGVLAPVAHTAAQSARVPYQLPPLPTLRPGQEISLEDALRRADQTNRSLEVMRVDLEAAAAKRRAAYAAIFPSVYGRADYVISAGASSGGVAQRVGSFLDRRELSAGVEASLPIVRSQRWAQLRVTRDEEELTALDVEQARQRLLYGVAETYFQAALLQRLITVFDHQAAALSRHLEAATARYRAGVGDLVDVKRAQTDLVSVSEEQLKATVALEDSRDALALLIAAEQLPQPIDHPRAFAPSAQLLGEDAKSALAQRWELRLSEKSVALADRRLTSEWLRLVPTLDASLQYAHVVPALDPLGEDSRDQWFAALVLSVPLLDYSVVPQLQLRELSLKQARLRLEDQRAVAEEELVRAQRTVSEAEQLVTTAQLKASLADDALLLSQANYVNGLGSALTVVDARRTSQTAHVDLETRRFELELARLALFRAVGTDIFDAL